MGTSEESLLLENIQEFVSDENKIVTCKWLSLTMSIHINIAKQALCNFVNEERNKGGNDDINVTYFVSGFGETKLGQQVLKSVVVPETDLETVKSTLNPVTSCHIYSVQRAKLKDYTPLYQTDYDIIQENLHNITKYSSITCPWASTNKERTSVKHNNKEVSAAKEQSVNEKNVSSTNISPPKDSSAKLTEKSKNKTSQIASMFAAVEKRDKKKTPSPELEKDAKSKDKTKEPKGGVRSFFNSQPEKPVENQKEKKPINETKDAKKESKLSSNKKQMDFPDDTGPQRKRRRIRTDLFDSSDEDEDNSVDEEDEHLSEQEQAEPQAHEEEEIEDDLKKKKLPSPKKDKKTDTGTTVSEKKSEPQTSTGRKRKRIRRLVPKQHIDEDGYMVTEKVWESDSTDASDEEEQKQLKTSPKAPAKMSSPILPKGNAGTKKKTSKPSPSKNKQTSLTSFFKRK